MFGFLSGKLALVAGVVVLCLVAALAGTGYLLKQSIAREAQAKQAVIALQDALASQVQETLAANSRYLSLDKQFAALQQKKDEIRTVTKKQYVYIRETAKNDEAVERYLNEPVPAAIGCLLSDTCSEN